MRVEFPSSPKGGRPPLTSRALAWVAAIGLVGLAAVAGAEKAAESETARDADRFDLPHLDERIDF